MRQWLSPRVKITGTRFVCCQDKMGGGVEEGGSRQPRCWGRGYFVLDIKVDTGHWHWAAVTPEILCLQSYLGQCLPLCPHLLHYPMSILGQDVCQGCLSHQLVYAGDPCEDRAPRGCLTLWRAVSGAGSSQSSPVQRGESRGQTEISEQGWLCRVWEVALGILGMR